MSADARLDESAAAKLLLAAAFLDLAVVLLLLDLTGAVLRALLNQVAPGAVAEAAALDPALRAAVEGGITLAFFLGILLLYWLVCEILLGGRTVGRAVLMLSPGTRGGARASGWQTSKRGFLKLSRLGLSGLRFDAAPGYDRAAGIVWRSPLAPGNRSAARNWTLQILSGRAAGRSQLLGRLDRFNAHRTIQIGRDPAWSDIPLDEDERVSSHHAILRIRRGRWEICDYGGGRGTPNKTRVGGRVLKPGVWTVISPPSEIQVADVKLRLGRDG